MVDPGHEPETQSLPLPVRRRILRGEPMTEPMPIAQWLRHTPYRDPRVRQLPELDVETRKALELAVRVGELMLRCGATTRNVETAVIAVAAVAGLRRLELDITAQSIIVQCPVGDGPPVTLMRVVRSNTYDFARLTAVHQLVRDLAANGMDDVESASQRLRAIQREPRPYAGWLVSAGWAVLAGSVCALLGGHVYAVIVAIISALVVDVVDRKLASRGLPVFFIAAAASAIAVTLTWSAYLLAAQPSFGVHMSPADFAYAIAGGIVVLLPGQSMATSVEDGITGYPITGAGRLFTVALSTSGIIAGVAIGLSVTLRLDSVLHLELTSPKALNFSTPPTSIWLQVICGAIGALAVAVALRMMPKHLVPAAILGAGAAGVAAASHQLAGVGATTAVAIAATLMGAAARLFGARLGAPALVLVLPAVTPLLPGLRIFRGMYDSVAGTVVGNAAGPTSQATGTLIGAAAVALAISAGVVLGDVLAAPLDGSVIRRRHARRR